MRQGKAKSEAGESGPQGCLSLLPSTGSLALSLPPDTTKEMLRFPGCVSACPSPPCPQAPRGTLSSRHWLPGARCLGGNVSKGHAVSELSLSPQCSVFTSFGEGMNEWVDEQMKEYRWLREFTSPSPRASQVAPWYKIHLPKQETQETRVPSLGPEDPLEQEMATHSSLLAWKIPWSEELGGQQSLVSQSWTRLSTHATSIVRPKGRLRRKLLSLPQHPWPPSPCQRRVGTISACSPTS